MPCEQTDLYMCKVSTSDAAWPANRTGNPAAAGSADAAASATGGYIMIFACTAQNQVSNSTSPGGVAIEGVCKERAQTTCEQNRRNAIAIEFVAIGENCRNLAQIATTRWADRQHISRIKQVQMTQKSQVGMPVTSGPCSRPSWQLLPLCVRSGRWLCGNKQRSSGLEVKKSSGPVPMAQFAVHKLLQIESTSQTIFIHETPL